MLVWLLCVPSLLLVCGCGGCREATPPQELSEKEKANQARQEREKADFLLGDLRTEPNGLEKRGEELPTIPVKPGHWTSATLVAQANRDNLTGKIETAPVPLNGMPYSLGSERSAALAKEQAKQLEFVFFPPEGREKSEVTSELTTTSGRMLVTRNDILRQMPAHQFFFLVLAAEPDRYSFLRRLDSVRAPSENLYFEFDMHYRVLLPNVKTHVPLPSSSLCWTSMAYLLWDRFDPARLTPLQTTALVDWLHWGGQIIVSGPDTLDVLAAGILKPYVPADPGGTTLWSAGDLAELTVDDWTMQGPALAADRQWTGIELQPHPEGEILVTSGDRPLVVERRVGRGRVVATAFSLTEPELRKWPKFDTLLNACLLRRPARRFTVIKEPTVERPQDDGTDSKNSDEQPGADEQEEKREESFRVDWVDGARSTEAARVSQLRYFSRDTTDDDKNRLWRERGLRGEPRTPVQFDPNAMSTPPDTDGPGVAGWNHQSDVARAAKAALNKAAGITIPEASFVVKVLALYLAVLVPLNWLVFRVLGRVELAWVAVPVLSIAFTVLVVRWAQLDIGFVRAEADVAVVELYEGYDRAHATHYTALYTSLATRFAAVFEGPAVAQPFPREQSSFEGLGNDDLVLAQGQTTRLEGFDVASNSTGLLHGEQMRSVGGALRLSHAAAGGWQVTNDTNLTLHAVGVLAPEGAAWIGELAPGEGAVLQFVPVKDGSPWRDELSKSPETDAVLAPGSLGVRSLYDEATSDFHRTNSGIRLLGWTEGNPGGMSIEPAASQQRKISFVVAHLRPPALAAPADDVGTPHLPVEDDRADETLEPDEPAPSPPTQPTAEAITPAAASAEPQP